MYLPRKNTLRQTWKVGQLQPKCSGGVNAIPVPITTTSYSGKMSSIVKIKDTSGRQGQFSQKRVIRRLNMR